MRRFLLTELPRISGIHTSLLEGTATTEQEPAVKSEKKTRSKRVKENFDELSVSIIKNKKRKNYVSYPTDGELLRDVATKQEGETKPNRVLRKNALKDHNPGENSEKVEPQIEAKSFIRKSRRYKKEDDLEETENHENVPVEVIAVPKSKKNKKKKKVESVIDNPREEAPAKKSKKKKKGKRTSSTIEDTQQNTNSKSDVFNRSATSIDSFHSAAGSPSKNEYTIVPDHVNNTLGKTEENSCLKPVTEEMTLEKSSISMAKENLQKGVEDILNMSHLSNEEPRRRKSNTRNATFDKNNTSDNVDVEMQTNLTASIVNNGQVNRGKSNKKEKEVSLYAIKEDVDEVINNDTFDKDLRRHSVVKDDTFNKSNASITKETVDYNVDGNVSNISNRLLKTRRSVIKDSTFDNSNASIAKEVVNDKMNVSNISNKHVKTRRSTMKNSTFDKSDASIVKENIVEVDLNVSRKQSTRKSGLKDLTFDKSNVSLTNVNNILEDTKPDLNVSSISNKHLKRKKCNVKDLTFNKQESVLNTTFEKEIKKQAITDSTINQSQHLDSTYEKEQPTVNTTYDKPNKVEETTFEKDISISYSFDAFKKGAMSRKSSIRDASFDKCSISIASLSNEDFVKDNNIISSSATKRRTTRHIFDRNETISESAGNTTYEKMENTNNYELKRKSPRLSKTPDIQTILNTTFEKESPNEGKENLISSSKTSLISSDNSSVTDKYDISHISITSDDNSEHLEKIVNITPVLIESSVDESHVCDTKPESPKPQTALKREGTFTKDVPEDPTESELKTPTKSKSTPTAGNTPYHVSNNSKKKSIMNVTRSLEKSLHATVDPAPRLTRVMFCSPVDSPAMFTQEKKKIIKSNLKGSNKSFVFDENGEFLYILLLTLARSFTHLEVRNYTFMQ